jgi:hypothetical protein
MRAWTSQAPASRSMVTIALVVLPRTIESSTTTSRSPRIASLSGLSLIRMPSWRMVWLGWMKVRPASTGASTARAAPSARRTWWTFRPARDESALAR